MNRKRFWKLKIRRIKKFWKLISNTVRIESMKQSDFIDIINNVNLQLENATWKANKITKRKIHKVLPIYRVRNVNSELKQSRDFYIEQKAKLPSVSFCVVRKKKIY